MMHEGTLLPYFIDVLEDLDYGERWAACFVVDHDGQVTLSGVGGPLDERGMARISKNPLTWIEYLRPQADLDWFMSRMNVYARERLRSGYAKQIPR